MVLVGALAGLSLGMLSASYVESMFYHVRATDLQMLAIPSLFVFAATLLAALRPVMKAVHLDPVQLLRTE